MVRVGVFVEDSKHIFNVLVMGEFQLSESKYGDCFPFALVSVVLWEKQKHQDEFSQSDNALKHDNKSQVPSDPLRPIDIMADPIVSGPNYKPYDVNNHSSNQ
jgi:hypothetical protein